MLSRAAKVRAAAKKAQAQGRARMRALKNKTRHKPGTPFAFEPWPHGNPRLAPILDLPLSVRTLNRLCTPRFWDAGVHVRDGLGPPKVAGDLEKCQPSHLLALPRFGRGSLREVEEWLRVNGMSLAPNPCDLG